MLKRRNKAKIGYSKATYEKQYELMLREECSRISLFGLYYWEIRKKPFRLYVV